MTLYLVQHGEAKAEAEDPERPLTARGRDDIGRLAALLARTGVRVARLEHSGKRRAQETAELLAAAVAATPTARSGLAPNDPVAPLAAEVCALAEDVMLVGHLPQLGRLASLVLTGREEPSLVAFTPGTLVGLERGAGWVIVWALPPALTAGG
jgi:phosphohistidine phosphatase